MVCTAGGIRRGQWTRCGLVTLSDTEWAVWILTTSGAWRYAGCGVASWQSATPAVTSGCEVDVLQGCWMRRCHPAARRAGSLRSTQIHSDARIEDAAAQLRPRQGQPETVLPARRSAGGAGASRCGKRRLTCSLKCQPRAVDTPLV